MACSATMPVVTTPSFGSIIQLEHEKTATALTLYIKKRKQWDGVLSFSEVNTATQPPLQ